MIQLKSIRKYRSIITVIILLGLMVTIWIYYAPYGARSYLILRQELRQLTSDVKRLHQQNIEIREEIARIKNDPAYLETIARQHYSLIKENEIVFEYGDKKKYHLWIDTSYIPATKKIPHLVTADRPAEQISLNNVTT